MNRLALLPPLLLAAPLAGASKITPIAAVLDPTTANRR